mmetsp:Transcript_8354/g.23539  ORF Transcript_8354/g.23539 Transcript_8354/m.23539 type:complete len:251 (+) Transcript_8354:86-838(+)
MFLALLFRASLLTARQAAKAAPAGGPLPVPVVSPILATWLLECPLLHLGAGSGRAPPGPLCFLIDSRIDSRQDAVPNSPLSTCILLPLSLSPPAAAVSLAAGCTAVDPASAAAPTGPQNRHFVVPAVCGTSSASVFRMSSPMRLSTTSKVLTLPSMLLAAPRAFATWSSRSSCRFSKSSSLRASWAANSRSCDDALSKPSVAARSRSSTDPPALATRASTLPRLAAQAALAPSTAATRWHSGGSWEARSR